ncbi:MAG: LysR family transcriptional regulator [Lawsonibacter sp.]|nr:LysR family transcriptional regulator [Lawsonibacter sp.]
MTYQSIEVFLAVVRAGSLSGAAQALYVTQPAVSRQIRALEEELGCPLLVRGRGVRQVELTDQGQDFVQVAEKWRQVWQETREVASRDRDRTLNAASVGSVSTYLLSPVFRAFLEEEPGRALTFHSCHSVDAYEYMAQGLADIAFISDSMYHPQVETVPAFREPMVLVTAPDSPLPRQVHPSRLDPARELRLPWNPEYDLWHSFWFSSGAQPRAVLDQMSLLEDFFSWEGSWADSWAIAPAMVARALQEKRGLAVRRLEEGPPDEIIYYLLGRRRKPALTRAFLGCLHRELERQPEIESYLSV